MGCGRSAAARVAEAPAARADGPKLLGQGEPVKPRVKVQCEEDGAGHAPAAYRETADAASAAAGGASEAAGPAAPAAGGAEAPAARSAPSSAACSSATSRSSARRGTLYRQRTTAISALNQDDLDVMVLSHSCFDAKALGNLGAGGHEATWKVQVGHNPSPIVIKLLVDTSHLGTPRVTILSNDSRIFPTDDGCDMSKIRGDFQHKWQFSGAVFGMHKHRFVEMRPDAGSEWLPATMTGQSTEGFFDVEAEMPDGVGGLMKVAFADVDKANIREASSHADVRVRRRYLMLEVPAQDPLQAVLSIDNCELVTHYFARPSPPPAPVGSARPSLALRVSRDRRRAAANVGRRVLEDFAAGRVRAVAESPLEDLARHAWTLNLGPFAEHCVEIEKSNAGHRVVKLVIDGEALVEACADDIDCVDGEWECSFRFMGHRDISFDLYEMDKHGSQLDSRSIASRKRAYCHECRVLLRDEDDMGTADLFVDGVNFKALAPLEAHTPEDNAVLDLDELRQLYGIDVPYKASMATPATAAQPTVSYAGGLFSICCGPPSVIS